MLFLKQVKLSLKNRLNSSKNRRKNLAGTLTADNRLATVDSRTFPTLFSLEFHLPPEVLNSRGRVTSVRQVAAEQQGVVTPMRQVAAG
jgi:hypothetical protein